MTLDSVVQDWLVKAHQKGWVVALPDGRVAITLEGICDLTRLRLSL